MGYEEIHCRMIEAISHSDNIQVLKISYVAIRGIKMLQDLSTYVKQSQSLKELVISLRKGSLMLNIMEVMKLFVVGTSIKKFKCIEWYMPLMPTSFSLIEYQELLTKLPDTLEELTLRFTLLSKENLQQLVEILRKVNELRTIKGTSNQLQVNLSNSSEGFY